MTNTNLPTVAFLEDDKTGAVTFVESNVWCDTTFDYYRYDGLLYRVVRGGWGGDRQAEAAPINH